MGLHAIKINHSKSNAFIYTETTRDTRSTKTPLNRASFQLQNTIFQHSYYNWRCISTTMNKGLYIRFERGGLINFSDKSICLQLFYAKRLGNYIHSTFIFIFLVLFFPKSFSNNYMVSIIIPIQQQ